MIDRSSFQVVGLDEVAKTIDKFKGKTLQIRTRQALRDITSRVVAPSIRKRTAMANAYGGHGGKYPTKGLLKKKVTTRGLRNRKDELAVVSTKPRQWWAHMVAQGTQPHEIKWRDKNRRTLRTPFGPFQIVQHPGARPVDYVGQASKDVESVVVGKLAKELFK